MIPVVVDKHNKNEYVYDLYSKLLKDRIIFLSGEICEEKSNLIISQLVHLENENNQEDIYIYINSNGGNVYSGLAIYDTIKYLKCDVCTLCIGSAFSMAAVILSSGIKMKRFCLINSRLMIHQPIGGVQGQATDILIHNNEITSIKNKLNKILSLNTKKNSNFIEKDTDRDKFMSSLEALKYGIIDYILINKY